MIRHAIKLLLAFFATLIVFTAQASPAISLPQAPLQYDKETLQRGAAGFVNYCMGCHSAQYMRYGRMVEDLEISPNQVHKFLIYNGAGLGDGMLSSMRQEDGREWFDQAHPPDLSLSAKLRGSDWLYAYLRSFYRDPSRPSGWNNTVFPNVAMPHVLANLQGVYDKEGDSDTLVQRKAGAMSAVEYNGLVGDIVSFMVYAAEPSRQTRLQTGYLVMAFLLVLLIFTYFLYREYWRDVN